MYVDWIDNMGIICSILYKKFVLTSLLLDVRNNSDFFARVWFKSIDDKRPLLSVSSFSDRRN